MMLSKRKHMLGIAFEGKRLTACALHRTGNRVEMLRHCQTTLSLDPLSSDPELVGREIRNALEDAGIRGGRCVVCVPLKWMLTVQAEAPAALSGSDLDSFIMVQAEREFPFAPDELAISVSRYNLSDETERATIVAMPAHHLTALQEVFKAANLRPVSITLGITALAHPRQPGIALLLHQRGVDLQVAGGGGVAALRSFDEDRQGDAAFDFNALTSQLRITLGQLPDSLRESLKELQVFGAEPVVDASLQELRRSLARLGINAAPGDPLPGAWANMTNGAAQLEPSARVAAAAHLLEHPAPLEFLPPKTSWLKQAASRVSARAAMWLMCAAILIVVGVGTALAYQHYRLSSLEKQWQAIEANVTELSGIQERVRKYRAWSDDSVVSLRILRQLTEAFPDEGNVWTKSVEIKGASEVLCSGSATSRQALLDLHNALKDLPGVEALHVKDRGEAPVKFNLNYQWKPGKANGK